MKKYTLILMLGVVVLLTSCVRKQVVLDVTDQRDSLALIVQAKDSVIQAVFDDINAIADNLALIKERENLITTIRDEEGSVRTVDEINSDLEAIARLLQENREKIAALQNAKALLRKANFRIDGLEKMISDLNTRLAAREQEIAELQEQLAEAQIQVESLNMEVAEHKAEIVELQEEKAELINQQNVVYYIVGSERELRDAEIVKKSGLIGRTLTVGSRGNAIESFVAADQRLLSEIIICGKKVTLVTNHPEGSYELVSSDGKMVEKLVIKDSDLFWSTSKILIVCYK